MIISQTYSIRVLMRRCTDTRKETSFQGEKAKVGYSTIFVFRVTLIRGSSAFTVMQPPTHTFLENNKKADLTHSASFGDSYRKAAGRHRVEKIGGPTKLEHDSPATDT